VRRLRFARTALNQALYLASLRRVRRCEVVHVFAAAYWSFLLAAAPAIAAGKRLGKRVVLNYHSGEADDHLSHWGKRVHPWLRAADEIVVPSEYLRAVFARHGYRARVVRNALDLSRFTYRERRLLRPRLLSTRNLESHYGVDTTIEAFAMLKRRYPEATLTVAGAGSEERRLRALARAMCGGGVRFLGRVEPSAIPALYESCDIYVNSSVIDNQPLSLLEAFAAGLPVVSTPTGDIGAMVRGGEMGVLVPPGDPSGIAGAVESLLDRPSLALQLAHRARQRVEAYAWPQVRDGWAAVYEGKA
jgi:glycosyltransferase involved in cell wall biosynthesis